MNELALFSGAGGGILGSHLLGWETVCAVEIEDYPRRVLLVRQKDGLLPRFPIWDDISTFDGKPWKGRIDIITGGFPCQDISCAGKGEGITGERSGLWSEMARIIGEVRPQYAFMENSPMLVRRGLAVVISDLAEMGYSCRWGIVGAHHAGGPHKRDRIWILAYSNMSRFKQSNKKTETESPKQLDSHCFQLANAKSRKPRQQTLMDGWESFGRGSKETVANASSKGLQRRELRETLHGNGDRQETHGSTTKRRGFWWDIDPADLPDAEKLQCYGVNNNSGNSPQPETISKFRDCGWQDNLSDTQCNGLQGCQPAGGQTASMRRRPTEPNQEVSDTDSSGLQTPGTKQQTARVVNNRAEAERSIKSGLGRISNELAHRLDILETAFGGQVPRVGTGIENRVARLKAIGNGQVPMAHNLAVKILSSSER